ncbi:MAG TPA: cytochrome C oxidase subunit IV family protein [Polyangiales bacterium]|nr:cytochrome C oxidase subunit IV family protein [Polyangiales bacterium]
MSADGKHDAKQHGADPHEADHVKHYTKIYVQLLVLFLVSVMGPVLGDILHSKAIVLVTAFGIAVVKAYLVCAHFMHLNIEKKYIGYLLTTTVVFMFLFYAGVSPDVMEHHGRNWENVAAKQETERALREHAAHPEGHHEAAEH